MSKTNIVIASVIAILLVVAAWLVAAPRNQASSAAPALNNVSVQNGVQIVEIRAKGGYQPRVSVAKAGVPTVIRFNTQGTFDCSSSVVIPSLGISKILPRTGSTDIDLGSPQIGLLKGSCGMGMYPFQVEFRG